MKKLKPYLSTLRLRAMLELQYRGAALGGMMTQLFFGLSLFFSIKRCMPAVDSRVPPFTRPPAMFGCSRLFFG